MKRKKMKAPMRPDEVTVTIKGAPYVGQVQWLCDSIGVVHVKTMIIGQELRIIVMWNGRQAQALLPTNNTTENMLMDALVIMGNEMGQLTKEIVALKRARIRA